MKQVFYELYKSKKIPLKNSKVIYGKLDILKRPRSLIKTFNQMEFSNPIINDSS
jgi:hypothetical protein